LFAVVAAALVSTTIHYADNYFSFDKYPQGALATVDVTSAMVGLSFILLTPAGFLGYWLYTRGNMLGAYGSLLAYSLLGLITPMHYTEAGPSYFPWWRNVSILSDGVVGAAVLGFVLWSAFIAQEWRADRATAGAVWQ
jgi:hypothetical protein